MAVPSVPADESAGNTWTAAKVNVIYDHLAWNVDDRPSLRVTANVASGQPQTSIASGSTVDIQFSNGSGTFNWTPTVNVGGWAAGTSSAEEIIVPETGVYRVSIHAQWESNATGYRIVQMTDATAAVGPLKLAAGAVNGHGTFMSGSMLHYFTANDLIGISVFQNSGGVREGQFTLSADWVNSSTS